MCSFKDKCKNMIPLLISLLFTMLFLSFILFLAIIYPDIVLSTKITDWITCIFTGLMLLVAYKGFILAKDWKGDLTRDDGYRIALKIKDEQLHNLRLLSHTFTYVTLAKTLSMDAINNPDDVLEGVNMTRRNIALTNIKNIYNLIERMKVCTNDLDVSFRNLNSVGWESVPDKKRQIDNVIDIVNDAFEIIFPICYASEELLGVTQKIYKNNGELMSNGYNNLSQEQLIALICNNCELFDRHTKQFHSMCIELLDKDMYILNFFRPIK